MPNPSVRLPLFLDNILSETNHRMAHRGKPDPRAVGMWETAFDHVQDPTDKESLSRAHKFSINLDYHHPGLSSEAYTAHPLRVGAMCLMTGETPDIKAGMVGLLHNVLEVTDASSEEVASLLGGDVARAMSLLVVDRSRQWDYDYKDAYYSAIEADGRSTGLVKVVDKLDNLFLIKCNSNSTTRRRYMDEIETWVLPLAKKTDLSIYSYLSELLRFQREAEPA